MFDLMPYTSTPMSIGNLFDSMARNFFSETQPNPLVFKTDIIDKGDRYLMQAELPGFSREDIVLDLNGETLTIKAQHQEEKEEKQENYLRRERTFGSYKRSFDVSGIQTESITASYQNGVLELTLPKKEPTVPANRQIAIT